MGTVAAEGLSAEVLPRGAADGRQGRNTTSPPPDAGAGELPPGDHGVAVFAANDSILWKLGQLMGGQPVWWAARRPRGLGRGNAFIAGPSCWFAGLIIRLGRTTPPLRCSGEGRCRAAYLPPVSGEGQLVMVLSTLSNCCCISSEASVKSLAHLAVSAGVLLYTEYPTSTMTDPLRQTSV